uniref:Uncharacterized protein ORF196 n=1 Tax=Nothoceros aenigmaticus TaxID=13813 RepID=C3RYR0_9EMBR|nr:hypothetical protein MeaeMp59 [Nothoceros aenigmaticus]ACC86816.1 hypothetical protein MeaeMp59 [Nothoceros aenigmaticus]
MIPFYQSAAAFKVLASIWLNAPRPASFLYKLRLHSPKKGPARRLTSLFFSGLLNNKSWPTASKWSRREYSIFCSTSCLCRYACECNDYVMALRSSVAVMNVTEEAGASAIYSSRTDTVVGFLVYSDEAVSSLSYIRPQGQLFLFARVEEKRRLGEDRQAWNRASLARRGLVLFNMLYLQFLLGRATMWLAVGSQKS